jgi:hypothetical protein
MVGEKERKRFGGEEMRREVKRRKKSVREEKKEQNFTFYENSNHA